MTCCKFALGEGGTLDVALPGLGKIFENDDSGDVCTGAAALGAGAAVVEGVGAYLSGAGEFDVCLFGIPGNLKGVVAALLLVVVTEVVNGDGGREDVLGTEAEVGVLGVLEL